MSKFNIIKRKDTSYNYKILYNGFYLDHYKRPLQNLPLVISTEGSARQFITPREARNLIFY